MQFFLNLKTKAKILTGFMIVIVINLLIVITSINALSTSQQAALTIDDTLNGAFRRINNLQIAVQEINLKFCRGLNPTDTKYDFADLLRDAPTLIQHVDNSVNALNVNFSSNPEYKALVTSMYNSTKAINETINQNILPVLRQQNTTDASLLEIYCRDVLPHVAESQSSSGQLIAMQTEMCIAVSSPAADPTTIYVISVLAAVSVIVAFFIGLYISNYIAKQVHSAIGFMTRMADGDFNFSVEAGSADEFGQYRQSLSKMRNSVGQIVGMTQSECVRLQEELNKLHQASDSIVQSTNNVQSQAITVAAASDEMVSTTADIARNCETAANGSTQCKDITSNGLNMVQRAFENVQQQVENTKDNSNKVERLAAQSREISSIVNTIGDIAAQTNLLALNAAIEAARAGDAGRGFAVVADEVRALATRTASSTNEISRMVESIQKEAHATTESIKLSVQNMDNVAQDAKELENLLNDITTHVVEVNNQVTQIATSTEEQTTATSEISTNAQSVNNASAEMTHQAQVQQQSIESTLKDLENLTHALSFFRLTAQDRNTSTIN